MSIYPPTRTLQRQIDRLQQRYDDDYLALQALDYAVAALQSGARRDDAYGYKLREHVGRMSIERSELLGECQSGLKRIDALRDEIVRRTLKQVGR